SVRCGVNRVHWTTCGRNFLFVLDELIQQILAENLKQSVAETIRRRRRENLESAASQQKLDLGKRQRIVSNHRRDLAQFRRFGFQKLAPSRNIEEEILHSDLCATRKRLLSLRQQFATRNLDRRPDAVFGLGFQRHSCHRS